jgi:hypothetical protein
MHDYFKGPFGGPPSLSDGRIGQIDQVANRAASNLLDGHAQALVSQGFTAESVRAFILNPAFTKAAERVGDAIFKQYPDQFPYPKVGPSREWRQGHHLFVVAARHGFADIEADLTKHLVSIGQPPDKAKEIAEKASQLFETELANEGVPKALATAHANTYGKNPPTAVGTGAKAAGWGERLVAALPTGAVETAAKSAKVVQEFIQASPLLMKALPIVGRVIPYVNTPIAALTSKHAYDVDTDPKTGWLERRLAEGAAAMNVVAAGAAYFPVPVLDWAASFTGGMISLGLSGMEWGVRSLREASEPPALAPQS